MPAPGPGPKVATSLPTLQPTAAEALRSYFRAWAAKDESLRIYVQEELTEVVTRGLSCTSFSE